MSVTTDKIKGYMIDISNKEIDKEIIYDDENKYYYNWKVRKDNIYLIYDGMGGSYTRLVYVLSHNGDISYEDNDGEYLYYLESDDIPIKVIEELREAYKEIVGEGFDLNEIKKVLFFHYW